MSLGLIFFLVCLASFSLGDFPEDTPQFFGNRIIGGIETGIEEFPYQASLEYGTNHRCGGVIIDARTVLTAAHCTVGLLQQYFYVRTGTANVGSGGQRIQVSAVIEHSGYDSITFNNDIALLKLASPLSFNNAVSPVTLPQANSVVIVGEPAVVSGWGVTFEGGTTAAPVLRKVEVYMVDRDTCSNAYRGLKDVTQQMICAGVTEGGRDACQGDSGGPLVLVNSKILVGIVSWGQGCARRGYPGVYANVQDFLGWIEENKV